MNAEVLTYSRSHGVFAGITLMELWWSRMWIPRALSMVATHPSGRCCGKCPRTEIDVEFHAGGP